MNTNVMTWNPFREMEALTDSLVTGWPRSYQRNGNGNGNGNGQATAMAAWVPPCDVIEEQERYLVAVDLPGFDKDNVTLSIEDGRLQLKGERVVEKAAEGVRYHIAERSAGRFQRSFTLPDDADTSRIVAEFKNGVLVIALEKKADAKPRLIEIKIK